MPQLKVTKLRKWWQVWLRYKWRLDESYVYQTEIYHKAGDCGYVMLRTNGQLLIKCGYKWDGASGPTWDTPSCRRGALVHDALYQAMRDGGLSKSFKNYADRTLERICIEDGMHPARASMWRLAVRHFGRFSLNG